MAHGTTPRANHGVDPTAQRALAINLDDTVYEAMAHRHRRPPAAEARGLAGRARAYAGSQ